MRLLDILLGDDWNYRVRDRMAEARGKRDSRHNGSLSKNREEKYWKFKLRHSKCELRFEKFELYFALFKSQISVPIIRGYKFLKKAIEDRAGLKNLDHRLS